MIKGYLIRPPKAYRWIFPEAVFRKSEKEKMVFLTFDDGPHPEATPYALDVLNQHGVKATFFVLGKNVETYPDVVERIYKEGHLIGNHGMNHLDAWLTNKEAYVADMECGKTLSKSSLFRPAYGKLTLAQYRVIKKTEKIVLWDVISGDFDTTNTPDEVLKNVRENVRNGSIIVMHDSEKAMKNMAGSLSKIIEELKKRGYTFGLV